MTMVRSLVVLAALSVGGLPTAIAQDPLERIPANADLVLRLKAPQQTIAKVAALAESVKPGTGDIVRQNAPQLSKLIRVPGLAGVDQSRDWYIVLSAKAADKPDIFFVIPATNPQELVAALPDRLVSRIEQDWVIYTGTAAEIPAPAEAGSGITTIMAPPCANVFTRGDVSLFINTTHLADVYAQQIESARQKVDALLQQIAAATSQANGMNMEAIMGMYSTMIHGLFQAAGDSRGCSVAVIVGDDGLRIEKHVAFAAGSKTAQVIAANPTSALASLSQLPAGAAGYIGVHGDMQKFIEWGWSMNASLMANDEAQRKRFEQAKQQWMDIEYGDIVGAFQPGSMSAGLVQYMAIVQAQPTAKVRDGMREMMEVLGTIKTAGMTQTMTIAPDAETIGDHAIDVISVKQELDPQLDPTGMQRKVQEMMFGPGGMVSRIAFLKDSYAQTMGGGLPAMKSLLAAIDGTPNTQLAAHRASLSRQANLLVLLDLPQLAVTGLTIASSLPNVPLPIDAEALPQLTLEPSYVGYTLAAEDDALRVQMSVPVEQFRGIVALAELLQQNRDH